jgi:hypothetical protein
MMKPRRMRRAGLIAPTEEMRGAGLVARTGETRNALKFIVRKPLREKATSET